MIEHARNPKSRKTLVRATALCLATATLASVIFTLLPARRAARLDPVLALSRR